MSKLALSAALFLSVAMVTAAHAETDADRQARIKAAISACDKGAAIPLDKDAKAPAVQFSGLFSPTFDLDPLKQLAVTCKEAQLNAPDADVKRLRLQWLRIMVALGGEENAYLADEIAKFAAAGSAEANYLLYAMYRNSGWGIDRRTGIEGLTRAAEAGHMEALQQSIWNYQLGPYVKRDPQQVVHFAKLMTDLPPQGIGSPTPAEAEAKDTAAITAVGITLIYPDFDAASQKAAFNVAAGFIAKNDNRLFIPYITALRTGRGTPQDAAKAREVLEAAVADDGRRSIGVLAEMLANGEGGPVDGKRAIKLLTTDKALEVPENRPILAALYLDNRFTGPRPREALRLLAETVDVDARIKAAALFVDYDEKLDYPEGYSKTMDAAAEVGEPGAAWAWAKLKLTSRSQFGNDPEGARKILAKLSADGDADATMLLAETQFSNLDNTSYKATRRANDLSDDEIMKLVDDGAAKGQAAAWRAKGKFLRAGVIYPQDDKAATAAFVNAAEGGDVEAMILAGEAYDDGVGIAENPRERLRWWREAAKLGSLDAVEKLASQFTFDSFDKLMTLREGVTAKVALFNNERVETGPLAAFNGSTFAGLFSGGRASDAGVHALAQAAMDGYRWAPAGLTDDKLLIVTRAFPDEIRVEIEKVLKDEGFYQGEPEGYFGPEVRAALVAWVDSKGPLPPEGDGVTATTPAVTTDALPKDLVDRVRDRVFTAVTSANDKTTQEERDAFIVGLNTLARYGDIASRWALVRNYHQAERLRQMITPAEITRYGLDLMVTRPEGADKLEFEFIFDVTAMFQDRKSGAFGEAFVNAVRDDTRLHDPLTLGGIMQQVLFAPGGCDAIGTAVGKAGIDVAADDGCAEAVQTALIAFAKQAGPSGVDAEAKKTAAEDLRKLDVAAN